MFWGNFIIFLLTISNGFYANSFLGNSIKINDPKLTICKACEDNYHFTCSVWDGECMDTLIFEGGGVRAVVYSGAVKRLEENNMMVKIKNMAGTSSGAQTAALLCCGYKSSEIKTALKLAPWKKILNGGFSFKGLYFLLSRFGIYDTYFLESYLDHLIYLKTGKKEITFQELYNISKIHLKVGVCSLKDQEFKYLDHITYPDMPVSKGLLASSSIPVLFTSTKWNEECFTDGGIVGNLPTTAFPKKKCLAFNLFSDNEFKHRKENPKNLLSFIKIVLNILVENSREIYSPKNRYIENIDFIEIFTGNVGILETNMDDMTINQLHDYGYLAVDTFLDSRIKPNEKFCKKNEF